MLQRYLPTQVGEGRFSPKGAQSWLKDISQQKPTKVVSLQKGREVVSKLSPTKGRQRSLSFKKKGKQLLQRYLLTQVEEARCPPKRARSCLKDISQQRSANVFSLQKGEKLSQRYLPPKVDEGRFLSKRAERCFKDISRRRATNFLPTVRVRGVLHGR